MKKILFFIIIFSLSQRCFSQEILGFGSGESLTYSQLIILTNQTINLVRTAYESYQEIKSSRSFLEGLRNTASAELQIMSGSSSLLKKLGIAEDMSYYQEVALLQYQTATLALNLTRFYSELNTPNGEYSNNTNFLSTLNSVQNTVNEINYLVNESFVCYKLAVYIDTSTRISTAERAANYKKAKDKISDAHILLNHANGKMALVNDMKNQPTTNNPNGIQTYQQKVVDNNGNTNTINIQKDPNENVNTSPGGP